MVEPTILVFDECKLSSIFLESARNTVQMFFFCYVGPMSFGFASLEGSVHVVEQSESMPGSPVSLSSSPPTPPIGSELAAVRTVERAHQTDPITQQSQVRI